MICKLKRIGIKEVELKWFESFLTNRKQRTVIGEELSKDLPVDIGLPQGSVLAPILFNIYINDVLSSIRYCKIRLFADDALLTISEDDLDTATDKMQNDLDSLYVWLCKNKLMLNVKRQII